MKEKFLFSMMIFIGCLLMFNTMQAQSPELIKYQAVLRDVSGNVVASTAKTVVVDILQGSSSGTSVYQESHNVTTTAQGVINLNIGGGTPISGTFSTINWSTNTYWAKLTVDATEITNGQLLSTPYALSVKGITYDATNSRVGIGTTSPSDKLTVNGDIKTLAGGDIILERTAGGGFPTRLINDVDNLYINTNNATRMFINSSGNVGIGNTNPSYKLDVDGVIHSNVDGGVCFRVGNDATLNDINYGNGLGLYGTGDATIGHLKLGSDGPLLSGKSSRLGIGTTDPGYTLDVNGTGMFRGHLAINTGSNDAILRLGPGNKAALGYAQNWETNNLYINGWSEWNGTYVNGNELYLDCRTWIYDQNDLVFKGYGANADYWMENYSDDGPEDFRIFEGGSNMRAYLQNGSNGWKTPSDMRLKDNIITLNVLDKIERIRGCSYLIKDSGMPQIGVIAQEMQAAFPAAVSGNESVGMLGVDYNAVAAIALQGVKELKEKVDQLEKENTELKAQIGKYDSLKAEIETLKNLIGGEKLGSR